MTDGLNEEQKVSVWDWGKDHWSTLAYVETRIVDYNGVLDNDHMRCNPRLHRALYLGRVKMMRGFGGNDFVDGEYKHPTQLKNGRTIPNHDDWSCIEDMVEEGMVRILRDQTNLKERMEHGPFYGTTITVALTDLGTRIAYQLREHKANGGNFSEFVPGPQLLELGG